MKTHVIFLSLFALLVSANAQGAVIAYGITGFDNLYRLDLAAGSLTLVGNVNITTPLNQPFISLAYGNGKLYATRQRKDLIALGVDPAGSRRPAITGKDSDGVWDAVKRSRLQ